MGRITVIRGRLAWLFLAASAVLLVWLAGAWEVASDVALFSAVSNTRGLPALTQSSNGPPSLRSRLVQINQSALRPETAQLKLNLFDDTVLTAVRDRVDRSVVDGYVWVGHVEGDPSQSVSISVSGSAVVGTVTVAAGEQYTIRPLGPDTPGVHVVGQQDPARTVEPRGLDHVTPPVSALSPGDGQREAKMCEEDGSVIDLMVVYTAAARIAQGGFDIMEATINQRFSDMITANQVSDLPFTWRLVEVMEVDYVQSDNIITDLMRLQAADDGYLDEVHTAREAAGADLVGLLVAQGNSNSCGFAYKLDRPDPSLEAFGFGVTAMDYEEPFSCNALTMAHEFGHNMGNAHDRAHASGPGIFPYSYGFQSSQNSFRTIMSYDCSDGGCPRINQWSNPRVAHAGEPTGIDHTADPDRSADAARSMSEVAALVANFRQSCTVTPPTATATPTTTAPVAETPLPADTATATPTNEPTIVPTSTLTPPPTATLTPTTVPTGLPAATATPTATAAPPTASPPAATATPFLNATSPMPHWNLAPLVVGR